MALSLRSWLRRLIPAEVQPPTHLPRQILAACGYFRLRTWLGSRGWSVPDAGLYRPFFSPWDGLPGFEEHYRAVKKHTMVSRDRCYVLCQTLRQALRLCGDVVECGVFRGGTALLEARTIAATAAVGGRRLHLFDSFQGMGTNITDDDSFRTGEFGRTSLERVRALLAPYPFVDLHAGYIPDTFVGLNLGPIVWAHVDLDLYESIRDAIDYLYPRLVPGGFLIFDDYGFPSCPGARRAVDEAFADKPEVPLCLPTAQCLVVKLGVTSAAAPAPAVREGVLVGGN
jgi:O-methyltransferase